MSVEVEGYPISLPASFTQSEPHSQEERLRCVRCVASPLPTKTSTTSQLRHYGSKLQDPPSIQVIMYRLVGTIAAYIEWGRGRERELPEWLEELGKNDGEVGGWLC